MYKGTVTIPQGNHRGTVAKIGTREHRVFVTLLKETRTRAGVRQVDIAERMGVPQSMISKYELGERRLDVLELREVCAALGVSLTDFVRKLEAQLDRPNETE